MGGELGEDTQVLDGPHPLAARRSDAVGTFLSVHAFVDGDSLQREPGLHVARPLQSGTSNVHRSSSPAPPAHRTCVLLAEDDASVRAVIARALLREGHRVLEAADGFELAAHVRHAVLSSQRLPRPDVIISDLEMPGPDGPSVLARMRMVDRATPIILMTGRTDRGVQIVATRLASAATFYKPFEVESLCRVVRAMVGAG